MKNKKNEQQCVIHDVIHSAIESNCITKENFVIDGKLDYPIRLAEYTFNSPKFGILSFINGSIMTEHGIIGVYQENGYTKFDFIKDKIKYTTEFSWSLTKEELNEAARHFIEHCV